ncbi:hypothetical protein NC653_020852 [Populus alba x Populus x berolinensis]|uniref:Serine-threonine/tyrosine-protein kinase catalytic domain-containing protein n=1 Tax=Populus alba x Populus x berolinensis TaxID=444605 RepID=A0AAD6MLG5_9ROSI|nr:hypothetical protein NC653_020852 [Populus alba x Populus x berolinensis]
MSSETPSSVADTSAAGISSSSSLSSSSSTAGKQKEKARVSRTSLILWHAHQNDAAAVRKLLEEDPSLVSARDYDKRTPLHVASLHGWIDVTKCLIEFGADVNAQDRWKNTPLADAEGAKKHSMIELLKSYGGLSYGQNGSHFEPKPVPPPLTNKCDWEIEPSELDFSNSNIIGKMLEGEPPFSNFEPYEAAKYVAEGHRPTFRSKGFNVFELRELTDQCWAADMNRRPTFLEILKRLEKIKENLPTDHHWHIFNP